MIVILPIRKGSKRIKNKNIKTINNQPLYKITINKLLKISEIKKIIITTDYNFKFSEKKIIVHKRPKHLRSNCNINKVIHDVIKNYQFEHYLQMHVTSPLLSSKTIKNAIKFYKLNHLRYDTLFSVTALRKRFWNDKLRPMNHKLSDAPTTQNLKYIYEENSGFYIFSKSSFIKNKSRIGKKIKLYKISNLEAFDIDTIEEFKLIKKIIESEKNKNK